MCKAIEEMLEESRKKGTLKVTCDHVINAMESFEVDMETAMDALKVPMEIRDTVEKTVLERMADQRSLG